MLLQHYNERTERAIAAFKGTFREGSAERNLIEFILTAGLAASRDRWQQMAAVEPRTGQNPGEAARHDIGEDDDSDAARPASSIWIQKKLSALVDGTRAAQLAEKCEAADMIEDALRLADLRDKHQEHSWMWALNPATGPVLPQEDWLRAMRLRLGCTQLSSEVLCASCGRRVLDKPAYHALCCARGESTRGHNRVRNVMHAGFSASDPGAVMEVMGLIPSEPDLRPADVLTVAAKPNVTSAIDVGITAPHASGAGDDCVESMRSQKIRRYAPYLPELQAQGIEYSPATFSAYGRRHPCVTQMVTLAAREAARRKGLGSHNAMLRRWYRSLACEVWRRASRMILACMPKEPRHASFLVEGEVEDGVVLDDADEDDEPEQRAEADDDLESEIEE
jgi:hypothetical protein